MYERSSKNGKIDCTSFMVANLIDRNLITKETVRAVFNRFEAGFENPDYISYEEFMTIVGDFLWCM